MTGEMKKLVEKAILRHYEAPDGVSFRELLAETILLGVDHERARCRRIANHYEKGGEEQAKIAGTIRKQIEEGAV